MPDENMDRRKFLQVAGMTGAAVLGGAALPRASSVISQSNLTGRGRGRTSEDRSRAAGSLKGTLEMWTFSASRSVWEMDMAKRFKALHPGVTINVTVYPYYTMHDKLAASILAGSGAPQLSDVEVNEIGRFFTPPIGLVDEGPLIAAAGGKALFYEQEAFLPATWRGTTYGIGSEVDPVIFYFRSDVLEKVGVKPPANYTTQTPAIDTWNDFVTIGKEIKKATGHYVMAVDWEIGTGQWHMISLARGVGLFDSEGKPQLDAEVHVETLSFLHDLVHKYEIGILSPGGNQSTTPEYASLKSSQVVASLDAEWFGYYIQQAAPGQNGSWSIQRAPRWPTGPNYTSEYGGTWMVIPKQNPPSSQELAWEFIKFMHFDVKNIIVEYEVGALYPSLKAASSGGANAALFKKGNPYFGGASIGELTGVVASSLRAPYTSPIWTDLVLPTGVLPVSVLEPYMTDATASPSDAAKLLGAAQKVAMEKYRALKL